MDIKKLKANKFKILTVILAVAVVITGYYTYGQYRMSQMDKYVQQANKTFGEANTLYYEAEAYGEDGDYSAAVSKMDQAINKTEEAIMFLGKAHQYADGPYKEYISMSIKINQLVLEVWKMYRSRLEYLEEGDYARAGVILVQEEEVASEVRKLDATLDAFKEEHPDVKEHIEKYWGV